MVDGGSNGKEKSRMMDGQTSRTQFRNIIMDRDKNFVLMMALFFRRPYLLRVHCKSTVRVRYSTTDCIIVVHEREPRAGSF